MSSLKPPFPVLSRAPIVEAIVDFRIRSDKEPISLEVLESFHESIKDSYPTKGETRLYQTSLVIDEKKEPQQQISGILAGYRYESVDKKFVLQTSPDGFTLSRLAPYTNWDELLKETKELFEKFQNSVGEFSIVRTATRFINKLEIPANGPIDFDDYLTASPKIPESLPQLTYEFLSRNVIPCVEQSAMLILTQSFQIPIIHQVAIPVIIDIDAFVEKEFSGNLNECWATLGSLRDLKDLAFFGAITDKTVELIK